MFFKLKNDDESQTGKIEKYKDINKIVQDLQIFLTS